MDSSREPLLDQTGVVGRFVHAEKAGATEVQPLQGYKRWGVVACLCGAFFLDNASGAALASSFRALEVEIGLSPLRQGMVLMLQSLSGSLCAPMWGYWADRDDRFVVLAASAFIWAVATMLTALVGGLGFMTLAVVRLIYGVGSAGVTPVVQSVVADLFTEEERGRAFAFCIAASTLGTLTATAVVTSISMADVKHIDFMGWQVSFMVLGVAAVIFSTVLLYLRESVDLPRTPGRLTSPWSDFVSTMEMPTFRVVLLQGAFVSTALESHAFLIIWVQYIGYANWMAGLLVSCGLLGTLLGCFLGGYLADTVATISPDHGRIYIGQLGGVLMLIFWLGLMWVPRDTEFGVWLGVMFFMFGFVKNWEYVGAIRPILVEVAPSHRRAIVIAYAACFDGVVSAMLGGPLIGMLAEKVYGYERTILEVDAMPEEQRVGNLDALTQAIATVTVVCIVGNLLAFSILHRTYAPDRDLAKRHDE